MRGVAWCLVAAAIALAAACGGAGPLTHSDFARDASRACDAANRRIGTSVVSLTDPGTAAAQLSHVIGVERATLAHLRGLTPPTRDLAKVDRWLAVHAQLVAELDTLRGALRAQQPAAAAVALDHATTLAGRASALARVNGIRRCRTPTLRAA